MPDNDFSATLEQAIEAALSDVNTTAPGTIVSYDAGRNRAVVRPSLPKRLADGTELPAPDVHEVPVQWMTAAGGVRFTFPVRAGDPVTLHFAQRSLDGWLNGDAAAPEDPRRFDLTDAFAVPGAPAALSDVDPDNIVLSMDGSTVTIEPGGTVRIKTTKVLIEAENAELTGSWKVGGDVVVDGDVRAGTVSLRQHVHLASGGSGIGGPPRP